MALIKRIGLFLLTNIAVLALFSIALFAIERIFGINISAASGQSYVGLLIYAGLFGFIGSFFSLMISKWMTKRAYGITPISIEEASNLKGKERVVYDTVVEIAERYHIKTPEVGIYNSPDPNAFATGATKNSALVAVSTGLLNHMNEKEIEGVVAHEMAHVLNGDMVTMALVQGVMNTFVIFFARIIADIVNSRTEGKLGAWGYFGVYLGLQILLGFIAALVVNAFSRWREYHADAGSARYVGKEKMIAALESLKNAYSPSKQDSGNLATMQINTKSEGGIRRLFMTHPSLEDRIAALENLRM